MWEFFKSFRGYFIGGTVLALGPAAIIPLASTLLYSLYNTEFPELTGKINEMSSWMSTISGLLDVSSDAPGFIAYISAADTLVADAVFFIGSTIGLVLFLLFTMFGLILALFLGVLLFRLVLKLISIFSFGMSSPLWLLFFLPLSSLALEVTWIDGNQILVSGTGGDFNNTVVTNLFGNCTNCLAMTPSAMVSFKESAVNDYTTPCKENMRRAVYLLSQELIPSLDAQLEDIGRFISTGTDQSSTAAAQDAAFNTITSYFSHVSCTQGNLVNSYISTGNYGVFQRRKAVSYCDGIYDYAHNVCEINYTGFKSQASELLTLSQDTLDKSTALEARIMALPTDPCQPSLEPFDPFPGMGQEQADAILTLLDHIDKDQHNIISELEELTNQFARVHQSFEHFATLFYNDSTVVTEADTQNSWTNVYVRGSSDLYSYDASNIMQRIELLLYGISGIENGSSTGMVSQSEYERQVDDFESDLNRIKDEMLSDQGRNESDIRSIGESIKNFFNSASFLGGGGVGYTFVSGTAVRFAGEDIDIPDLAIGQEEHSYLESFARIVRICSQILYHLIAVVGLFFFYRWFILMCHRIFKWVTEILNGAFGDS